MRKLKLILLCIAIVLLPFNGLPLSFFGSLSAEASIYPLLALVGLSILSFTVSPRIKTIDMPLMAIACLLLVSSLISGFYNVSEILSASHLDKTGTERFVQQFTQLVFGFLIVSSIGSTIESQREFVLVTKVVVGTVWCVGLYAIFQLIAYKSGGALFQLHSSIGTLIYQDIFVTRSLDAGGRLHSVSQEPALLSMFLVVTAPYVIVFGVSTKRYYHCALVAAVIILTYSRLGYVAFIAVLLILYFLKSSKYLSLRKVLVFFPVAALLILSLMLTPVAEVLISIQDVEENTSNAARFAGAVAATYLWFDSDLFWGIGLGQAGFYLTEYLPVWGFISGEIQEVSSGERWPFIHNLLIKILLESGLVGFLLWVLFFVLLLSRVNALNHAYSLQGVKGIWLGHAVYASLVGCVLIMFNRELFSNMNIWIGVGLAVCFIKNWQLVGGSQVGDGRIQNKDISGAGPGRGPQKLYQ